MDPTYFDMAAWRAEVWPAARRAADEALAFLIAPATLLQCLVILGTFAIALMAVRPARRLVDAPLANLPPTWRWRRFAEIARELMLPVVWVLLQWLASALLAATGQGTGIVRLTTSLLTAWIAIRLVSVLIVSRWASRWFAIVTWAIAALNAVGLLEPASDLLDRAAIAFGETRISLLLVVKAAIIVAVLLWLSVRLSDVAQSRVERSTSLSPSMRVLLSKATRLAFITVSLVIALNIAGINLTALTVFSGALGLGLGFGLQKIVSNLFSGAILLLDKSLKPGDVIEIDTVSGWTYGWVNKVNARFTSVVTRDGKETLIPNEMLIANPVTNWSFSDRKVRVKAPLHISYYSDVELAIRLCIEAAAAVGRVIDAPRPICLVVGFGDSSVDLELRFWIEDPEAGVRNIMSEVYLEVWKRFRAHGVEIPFPQQDLHVKEPVTIVMGEADRMPQARPPGAARRPGASS